MPFVVFVLGIIIVGVLIRRLWRDREESAKLELMQRDMQIAHEIQLSMLPHGEVKDKRLKIKGYLKPAREVGGDLYDYFVRDEKLFFCIGDVSGKGAAAINEASVEGNEKNMFVTLFIGVLDLPTGKLQYCNAGHDCPISIQHSVFSIQTLECDANLPVGVFGDTEYTMQDMTLEHGSTLFLYTDGLTEAKNKAREMFGKKRVVERLTNEIIVRDEAKKERVNELANPQALIDTMTEAVHAFVGDAEQSDDLTILVIHYESNF